CTANSTEAVPALSKVRDARPNDPLAVNDLVAAILFRELYHAGALNSTLYSGDSFLNQKRRVEIDPKAREQFRQLVEKAVSLSEAWLAANGNDVEALYTRSV